MYIAYIALPTGLKIKKNFCIIFCMCSLIAPNYFSLQKACEKQLV